MAQEIWNQLEDGTLKNAANLTNQIKWHLYLIGLLTCNPVLI